MKVHIFTVRLREVGDSGRAKGRIERFFGKVFARGWGSGKVGGVGGVDLR
jgi:hypothetical protein